LYDDTLRWWAHRKFGDDILAAESDPDFQEYWLDRLQGEDKETRLDALKKLGILTVDQDGNWKYSNAFMAWIFEDK
jgi:hypothetical protein